MPTPQKTNQAKLPQRALLEEERLFALTQFERETRAKGFSLIAGVDEAGRGPLAGPVAAAACMIEEGLFFEGINDSKLLSEKERLRLFHQLCDHPGVLWAVAFVEAEVIDEINILQATRLAMKRAVEGLPRPPEALLIDALLIDCPSLYQEKIIHGDLKSQSIAAASILAKTLRDEKMREWHQSYPLYGFDRHKGYGTKAHREAIALYGLTPIHRKSFDISKK